MKVKDYKTISTDSLKFIIELDIKDEKCTESIKYKYICPVCVGYGCHNKAKGCIDGTVSVQLKLEDLDNLFFPEDVSRIKESIMKIANKFQNEKNNC